MKKKLHQRNPSACRVFPNAIIHGEKKKEDSIEILVDATRNIGYSYRFFEVNMPNSCFMSRVIKVEKSKILVKIIDN